MLPLPSRSHPQKQNRAVYTKELTHLNPLSGAIGLRIALFLEDSGYFIFWGPNFHLLDPNFHHLRKPTIWIYTPFAIIFPNSSLSTYAHGVFGSCVKTVSHFSGTASA
jgi:hypothetical protein